LGESGDWLVNGGGSGVDGKAGAGQTGFKKKQADDERVKERFPGQAEGNDDNGGQESGQDKTAGSPQAGEAGESVVEEGVGQRDGESEDLQGPSLKFENWAEGEDEGADEDQVVGCQTRLGFEKEGEEEGENNRPGTVLGEDFFQPEGKMGGVTDGPDGLGESSGEGQVRGEENKDAKEKRQTGEENLEQVPWFLEPEDEADQEKEVDREEAVGELEEGKKKKEVEKEAPVFPLVATEAIESAEKWPEGIKLEMG